MSDRSLSFHLATPLAAVICLALLSPPAAGGGIKCWTNKHGVRECGNVVPPEYAQEGHEAIGRHGLPVEEKERALTEEEIAEREREARERAELERQQVEQERHDRILLQTFSSEEDIISSRDDKISMLEASISLAESRIATLEQELGKRIEQAASQERGGKAPSAELLKDIDSLERQIERNRQFIADTREEQAKIRNSHDADIARFRELKGLASP